MVDFFSSPAFTGAQGVFPTGKDATKSPLIGFLAQQAQTAATRAASGAEASLRRSGFGRSSFAPQIAGGMATAAEQPYIGQMAQTGENLQQQQAANFMNLLGQATQAGQYEQQYGLQKQKMEEQNQLLPWLALLSGGSKFITDPMGGFLDILAGKKDKVD